MALMEGEHEVRPYAIGIARRWGVVRCNGIHAVRANLVFALIAYHDRHRTAVGRWFD
jgi:hypothetical protein